jgi:hypothetical protein
LNRVNRQLAYLTIIGLAGWLAGMAIHNHRSQSGPFTIEISQPLARQ